jgi:hypothetical protein
MHIQMMWPQEEVVKYTFVTGTDIPIPWEWLYCRTSHVGYWEKWNFIPPKTAQKTQKWKMFPKSIFAGQGNSDIVLHHAKKCWIYHHA